MLLETKTTWCGSMYAYAYFQLYSWLFLCEIWNIVCCAERIYAKKMGQMAGPKKKTHNRTWDWPRAKAIGHLKIWSTWGWILKRVWGPAHQILRKEEVPRSLVFDQRWCDISGRIKFLERKEVPRTASLVFGKKSRNVPGAIKFWEKKVTRSLFFDKKNTTYPIHLSVPFSVDINFLMNFELIC